MVNSRHNINFNLVKWTLAWDHGTCDVVEIDGHGRTERFKSKMYKKLLDRYSLSNLVVTKFTANGQSSWPSALFHPFDQFEKSHITFLEEFGWGYLDFTIFFVT